MKIDIFGTLPIPVGHRVAVRWYHKTSKGLLYGTDEDERPTQPTVEDLDTGIFYGFEWVFDVSPAGRLEPVQFGENMSQGVREVRRVVGRVTKCRILSMVNTGHLAGMISRQTELTIAPEDESQAPYR